DCRHCRWTKPRCSRLLSPGRHATQAGLLGRPLPVPSSVPGTKNQRQLRIGREGRPAIAKSRSAAAADTTAAETASPREQYLSEVERSCAWIAPSCYYDCVRGESVRFWPASGHSLHCSTNRLPATPATAQGTRAGF